VQYAKLANLDGFYTLVKASRIDAELNPSCVNFAGRIIPQSGNHQTTLERQRSG
jgi:hypothetical protein